MSDYLGGMFIDAGHLKTLREAAKFEGGVMPWQAAAALHAFGVTPTTPMVASVVGTRLGVMARLGRQFIAVSCGSEVPNWWNNRAETPADFWIEAVALPIEKVRGVSLVDLNLHWGGGGSATNLYGRWEIEVEGLEQPISLAVHGEDEQSEPTDFIRALIADTRAQE